MKQTLRIPKESFGGKPPNLDPQQLEPLIEDLAIEIGEQEHKSLHTIFLPSHLKMSMAKAMINYTLPRLGELVPEIKDKENLYPISKLINQQWNIFNSIVMDQKKIKMLEDDNFLNFMRQLRKFLIFMCENDCYYRAWVELFYVLGAFQVLNNKDQFFKPFKKEEKIE
jgi:hypothetical protein